MNPYEILLMLDPELPEERQGEIVQRMRQAIEQAGGSWTGHDAWGRRKLAYEIDKKTEGDYHLVTFDSDPATLAEVSRVLRITDGVMRHMPLRRIERTTQPREAGADSAPSESAEHSRGREPAPVEAAVRTSE
ncbi:MAG: 30S ribosomal protein S6 [Thermoleophilia bacterium]|nr:30S ribosomal protein S6 [Thermoleophilia bacterium]